MRTSEEENRTEPTGGDVGLRGNQHNENFSPENTDRRRRRAISAQRLDQTEK